MASIRDIVEGWADDVLATVNMPPISQMHPFTYVRGELTALVKLIEDELGLSPVIDTSADDAIETDVPSADSLAGATTEATAAGSTTATSTAADPVVPTDPIASAVAAVAEPPTSNEATGVSAEGATAS